MANKIHSTAIISAKARLGNNVEVGPWTVIGADVKIADNVIIGQGCLIEGDTVIGSGCKIFTGAVIGSIPQDLKYKGEKTKVVIGENNVIREYCTINIGTVDKGTTEIGDNNLIMAYSHIAHDCLVGSHCVLANCATLAGHVTIEDRVVMGGLSAIHQFSRAGKLSIIGGCSKVVQDIPPFSTCDGHPAKVFGLNLVGLRRSQVSAKIITDLKQAFKFLFFSGLNTANSLEKVKKEVSSSPEILYLTEFLKSSKRGVTRAHKDINE